ncbi:MAG: hypothetical protein QNJ81_07385 [Acidimicrobiia bacterium]|nr:hypothetical protein [Acidimicrobiia bacterium]
MIGVALIAAVIAANPSEASAYPNENHEMANCGYDSSITYKFVSGVPAGSGLTAEPWTTSLKNLASDGMDVWAGVKNSWGASTVTATESSSGEWLLYSVSDLGDFGGAATCNATSNGGYIVLDFRKNNGSLVEDDSVEGLAAHEIGHAFGFVHTGMYDSWYHPGEAPTMVGCATMQGYPYTWPNHLNVLEDDDHASVVAKTGNGQVNPNPSFEHGSAPGWKKSGGSWSVPAGGVIGSKYLVHTGYGKYVKNRVRLFDLTEGDFNGQFRVGFRYKEPSSHQGSIRFEMWAKVIDYDVITGPLCAASQFPESNDLNDPDTLSDSPSNWTILRSLTRYPSTVWSGLTWSSYYSLSNWEAADFEIRMYNHLEDVSGPLVVDGDMHVETGYVWPGRS